MPESWLLRHMRRFPGRERLATLRIWLNGKIFDWRYGTVTCGVEPIEALTVEGPNVTQGVHYEPSLPEEIEEALGQLSIDFPQYTFIDFGSGKGRVLLIAAMYPFRRVIGVEFAEELHRMAVRNITSYHTRKQRCRDILSVHADASQYVLPDEPLVLFFNNPFRHDVMTLVVRNIGASLERYPRQMIVVAYGRWTLTGLIERLPGIRRIGKTHSCSLYEVSSPRIT